MSKQVKVGDRCQVYGYPGLYATVLAISYDQVWVRWDDGNTNVFFLGTVVVAPSEPEYPRVRRYDSDIDVDMPASGIGLTARQARLLIKRLEAALAELEKDNG